MLREGAPAPALLRGPAVRPEGVAAGGPVARHARQPPALRRELRQGMAGGQEAPPAVEGHDLARPRARRPRALAVRRLRQLVQAPDRLAGEGAVPEGDLVEPRVCNVVGVERAARADEQRAIRHGTVPGEGAACFELAVDVDAAGVLAARPAGDHVVPFAGAPGRDVADPAVVVEVALGLRRAEGQRAVLEILVEHAPVGGAEEGAVDALVVAAEPRAEPEAHGPLVGAEVARTPEHQRRLSHLVAPADAPGMEALAPPVDERQDRVGLHRVSRPPPAMAAAVLPSSGR